MEIREYRIARILYKPMGMLLGILGGLLARAVFERLWPGDEAPEPTDARNRWAEVVLAGTLEGAVHGGVKAAIDRAGAVGFAKVTGEWPGEK